MTVRFIPDPLDDDDLRPMALNGPKPDVVVTCRFCKLEWRMPQGPRAEASLRRHFTRKHPRKGQPAKLTSHDLRPADAPEVHYLTTKGTTKRSRENRLRVTDGRVHPVTVRRVDDEPRQGS